MKLIANSSMKTTAWLPILLLSKTANDIHEKLFPRIKSEFQIRDFSCETWKIQIPWNLTPTKNFPPHSKLWTSLDKTKPI